MVAFTMERLGIGYITGKVQTATYQVTMRKTRASQVGPALGWLSPDQSLVEISITGVQPAPGETAAVPGRGSPPESLQKATVVVDPARVPYRIVLWMWE